MKRQGHTEAQIIDKLRFTERLAAMLNVLTINFETVTSVAKELSLLNRQLFYTLKEAKQ